MGYFWTEERVNTSLEQIMVKSFNDVYEVMQKHKCSMRIAAYILAIALQASLLLRAGNMMVSESAISNRSPVFTGTATTSIMPQSEILLTRHSPMSPSCVRFRAQSVQRSGRRTVSRPHPSRCRAAISRRRSRRPS